MSSLKNNWTALDNNREINEGAVVSIVKPRGFVPPVPVDCPTCNRMFKDHADIMSYETFGCCDECSMAWAQPNREKWVKGWRPEPSVVKSFMEERKKLPTYVVR